MEIYDNNGTKLEYSAVLANLPITESCEHVEELMKADHIVLSWRDSEKYTIPVGAYITYKGVNYALLEPYSPEQKSDDEFEYTPNFQHPKMYLGKVPFRFPTTDTEGNSITLLEWPYSGDLDTLLTFFCRTMESVLGLTANTFNYSILGEIDMVVSTTFNTEDILSALTNVANKLKCEWHIDWDYKILYFGHIELSRDEVNETVLEVGVNVGTPSVRSSKEGFYNTYEPQGSTRNISKRAASGEYVQGDVRLALNETDYPDKVIYTNESGTVIASLPQGVKKYVKPLIFDNIFPKLDLYVYDVRCRERDLLDDNGEKIIDHYDGSTPVYKRYAVWYMRLAYATKVEGHVTQWHDYTINPETDIISGKNLGGAFQPNTYEGAESFPLAGRGQADDGGYGFELIYHSTGETIPASGDDTGVVIKAGDYEIVFQQQNDYILPTTATQGIIPKGVKVGGQEVTDLNSLANLDDGQKGNIVDLYNIVIDNRYYESAQSDLAQETLKYIANQFKDNNSYTLKSDVVAFKKRIDQDELLHTDSSLYIGEKVIYKNGDYELETRVMKLTTKLDYAFEQEIVVGNEVLKGTQTTLKEQVQTILSGGTGNGGGGGVDTSAVRKIIQAYVNPRFLSKISDDTAQGFLTLLQGLQIGSQDVEEAILGEGGLFQMGADGKVHLITDSLYVRMRAYFDSVVIREYKHESGNRIVSPAQGFNASRVEYIKVVNNVETIVDDASEADYFRCYWRVDDGEKKAENQFIIGDLAFCEHADIVNGSLVTKRYWRVVIGRNAGNTTTTDGEAWIDLSNDHNANGNPKMTTITWEGQGGATQTLSVKSFENSSNAFPEAHDDICMLGCVVDSTRQGAIIEYVSGVNAPTYQIYQGLGADASNPYTLTNKNQISIGYNSATGKADMKVYGEAYIGDRNRTTFIEYKQDDGTQQHRPALNIKAHVEFTNSDQELDSLVQAHQRDDSYDDTEVRGLISGLQEQIDGQIETWFYNYSPVNVDASGAPTSNVPLNVAPYSDWTTDNDKIAHLGDTFTNNSTGYCWRFTRNEETNAFEWVIIEDSAVIAALQNAARAQDTADHKRRVFICDSSHQTPTPPYDEGDLWVNVKYPWATGATYDNEILKCVKSVPRTEGGQQITTFSIDDWSVANGYTAKLNDFVNNTYAPFTQNIQTQVDKKAETFRQATDPSTSWTAADKPNHVGDLWYNTGTNNNFKYQGTYIYENTGTAANPVYGWVEEAIPDEVFDKIDGKAAIYVGWEDWVVGGVSQLKDKDLYIPNTGHNPYKANKVYRWKASDSTWNEISYTDDTAFNSYIDEMLNGSHTSGSSSIVAAATQRAIMSALGGSTIIEGGLMLTSMIALRQNTGTAENPQYTTWAGISGIYDNTLDEHEEYSGVKGHGIAAWYGGAKVDLEDKSKYWTQEQIAAWEALTDEQKAKSPLAAKSLFRMDGSGYLATANITWNKAGAITIKNITTLSDSNNKNILNELTTFNSAFKFATDGEGSTTAVYIKPQVPFETLYIGTSSANKKEVATKDWANGQFVTKTFFARLFQAFNGSTAVDINDLTTTIDNIKAMFSFWSQGGITALGQGSGGGGGGGGSTTLYGLNDVSENATHDGVLGAQEGYVLTYNASNNHWYAAPTAQTYTLPQATSSALGGIKIGYDGTTAKTYAIQLDNNGKAYVAVPWTDTTYTLPVASSNARGGVKIGYTTDVTNRNYAVQLSSEKMYVNVPWTDTTYSVFVGSGSTAAVGLVPKPSTTAGTAKFLREDATWAEPAYPTDYYSSSTSRTKNTVLAAPNGSNGVASFRALVAADIPNLGAGKITSGTFDSARIPDLSSTYAAVGRVDDLEGYFTSGSANTAIALATPRTLWGQSFDGSANVSGNMTSVGDISFSATGKKIGGFLYFNTTNTRLGVNTSSPSYRLHVNGTFYASGNSSIGGTFGVTNATTLSSTLAVTGATTLTGLLTANGGIVVPSNQTIKIGDAILAWDSTNTALKLYKLNGSTEEAVNFYATGGVAALGQSGSGGGGGGGSTTLYGLNDVSKNAAGDGVLGAADGYVLTYNGTTNHWYAAATAETYVLPQATSGALGGIKIGYSASGKNYAIVLDNNGKAYVNVPWADHYAWSDITGKPLTLTKNTTGFSISGGTTSKTLTVSETYTLGAACAKDVTDNSSATAVTSSDTNLITGRTLYYAGYVKSSGVTSITLKAGTGISLDTDNTAITSTGTRTITNSGVRAATINGNYLRINTNGTNADLTIPYASSAGSVAWDNITSKPNLVSIGSDGVSEVGQYMDFHYGSTTSDYSARLDVTADSKVVVHLPTSSGTLALTSDIPTNNNQLTNGAGYVTSSGVTSLTMGTGIAGTTITSTGTISINSTYQTYISHGESAYGWGNHAGLYLPIGGGVLTGNVTISSSNAALAVETPNVCSINLHASTSGSRGLYDDGWVIKTNGTNTYLEKGGVYAPNGFYAGSLNGTGIQIGRYDGTPHDDVIERYGGAIWLQYYSGNNVAIGQVSSTYKLNVAGDIYATGGVTSLSDIRKKDVISYDLPLSVTQIANAPTIKFLWKDKREEGEQVGTIAQYWEKVLPQAIKSKSGELSMSYGVAALVAAITTARKVVDHEARIKALEKENRELKEELNRLKIA